MCGIIGAISERHVAQIMLEGLKRLEYRGYDSAGLVIIEPKTAAIQRLRSAGKVDYLAEQLKQKDLLGFMGIAHTRWATHGKPTTENAHPHISDNKIAVVHNGIIENHEFLRQKLMGLGYHFVTETDTEVIVHLLHHYAAKESDFIAVIKKTMAELAGAYALGIVSSHEPNTLYAVRKGSPLVIGVGIDEYFIASDPVALLPVTQKFIYLAEGDITKLTTKTMLIVDQNGNTVQRAIHESETNLEATAKGNYRHYMQKEIFEQPDAMAETINAHIFNDQVNPNSFGHNALTIFPAVKKIQIVACGTSYHAGLVARYWLESIAKIPTEVDIASEYRYRDPIISKDTLFIALSQSGETADTLAALHLARKMGVLATLGICNVKESTLARETDLLFLTRAGTEIGVAATKTFTAQLIALLLLNLCLLHLHDPNKSMAYVKTLTLLPKLTQTVLELDVDIKLMAHRFAKKNHALFLGRGIHYPIALEGALKLKEISYLHAEGYPAGELKHGPLALVDDDMPVIVIVPKNALVEKLESNIQEVKARQGDLYLFTDAALNWQKNGAEVITMPSAPELLTPILYTIPLQLLAYHIAMLKGTDVDHPRNLAKSVTVE